MMTIRVFLLEDDQSLAATVLGAISATAHVQAAGHAASLGQARASIHSAHADVLIADLQLPDGDGSDFIREVHAEHLVRSILVFTTFGDETSVLRAIEAGANGYLLKGCSDPQLILAIEQAANGESPISPAIARHVLDRLRRDAHPVRTEDGVDTLTEREVDVLRQFAQGYIVEEIATRLAISPHTVRTHIRHIYEKLQVSGRGHAVYEAQRRGYL